MFKKYKVVGYEHYEGEYDGRPYEGYYVYGEPVDRPANLFGYACEKLKVKKSIAYIPCIGDVILVANSKYGVSGVMVMEQGSGFPGEGC